MYKKAIKKMTSTHMPHRGGGRVSKLPLLAFEAKRHANHDAIVDFYDIPIYTYSNP